MSLITDPRRQTICHLDLDGKTLKIVVSIDEIPKRGERLVIIGGLDEEKNILYILNSYWEPL